MKIPKFFHPILGIITGTILFLMGIAAMTCAFVAALKAWQYAKPYAGVVASNIIHWFQSL